MHLLERHHLASTCHYPPPARLSFEFQVPRLASL
jgi:hypothetical protein